MVAYYPFDYNHTSGVVYDYSNFSNDGTMINLTDNHTRDGVYSSGAYEFDGSDDSINIDGVVGDVAGSTTGTWSFWIKIRDATPSLVTQLVSFADTDADTRIHIYVGSDTGYLTMIARNSGTNLWRFNTDSQAFTDNTWAHVAIVQNGTYPVFFVDGVEVSQSFSVSTDMSTWFSDLSGIDNGRVGAISYNSVTTNYLNGSIDDLMIFNRTLTQTEIEQIYNSTYSRFYSTGEMLFQNLNFGTNNTVNISISGCQQLNGSQLSFKINDGNYADLNSTCMFEYYNMTGDLTDSNLTLKFNSSVYQFYSPLLVGNLTLNDYYINTDSTPPTYSNEQVNSTVNSSLANFSLVVNDGSALESNGYYIFSTNNTGVWINDSEVNFTSTPQTIYSAKTLNDSVGNLVSYRWYIYDNAGNMNDTGILNLTTTSANSGTISILYPGRYVLFQRHNSTSGEVKIVGNYSGTPSSIEASFNNGSWTEIDSSPSNSVFTGYFNASIGQGNLSVRFSNNYSINFTVTDISIGDLMVISGQSNAEGNGDNNQTLNESNLYLATLYYCPLKIRDAGVTLSDCIDSSLWKSANDSYSWNGKGSFWPIVANYLIQNQSVPVSYIQTAVGGSNITAWQDLTEYYNNSINLISLATNGTMKVKTVLWFQGEADINLATTYSSYKGNLTNYVSNILRDTNISTTVLVGQTGYISGTESNIDNVRKAQLDLWADNSNVSVGPSTYDIYHYGNDVHFRSDLEIQAGAERWWVAIGSVIYGVGDGRGPRISSITFNEGDNDTLILDFAEDSLPLRIGYWNGTSGPKAMGFNITVAGGTVYGDGIISSTEIINQNQLRVNLTLNVTADANVSFGRQNYANNKSVVTDSSLYYLPLETFYNQSISMISDSTKPTFTTLPNNQSIFYLNQSLNVTFAGTDETGFSGYTINDTTNFQMGFSSGFLINNTPLAAGNYFVNVSINDSSNNINWTIFILEVNKSLLNCNVLFNETSPKKSSRTFLIYTDCSSGFQLYRNGSIIGNNSEQSLSENSYNFSVFRNDTANYSNIFDDEWFVLDGTSPSVIISSPTSGQSVTESSLSLSITTNENSTCNYSTDSGATNSSLTANSTGTGHTGTLSSLTDGDYTLNVYCADIVSNINNTMSTSFSVSIPSTSSNTLNSGGSTTYTPRDEQVDEGYTIKLKKNNKVKLDIKSEEVNVQVKEVGDEEVTITVEGESYTIKANSSEKIDLDSDGIYDLEISNYGTTLTSLGKKAKLEFKEISEEVEAEQQEEVNENVEVSDEDEETGISFWKKIGNFFERIWDWVRFWK